MLCFTVNSQHSTEILENSVKYHIVGQRSHTGNVHPIIYLPWIQRSVWEWENRMNAEIHSRAGICAVTSASPSGRHGEPSSFKSSPRSGVAGLSPSDLFPEGELVNMMGRPLAGGISIPMRRYFLRLLLIHVCKAKKSKYYRKIATLSKTFS